MIWELAPITGKITGLIELDTGLMGIYLSGRWSSTLPDFSCIICALTRKKRQLKELEKQRK